MGKAKKVKVSKSEGETDKTQTLADQILTDKSVKLKGRNKIRNRKDEDDSYVDDKLSKKILEQARLQQAELEEEHGIVSDGKLWTADRIILRDHEVISEADVAITSVGTDQEEFDDISALVSIVEIDNHDNLTSINIKQQEIKSLSKLASDSSDSLVSEGPVLDMPPICNWISSNVLGQHGGELLIHFDKFAGILTQKDFFYRPGMILFGTKVVFTLLVCSKKHWMEITDTDSVKKGTSFISYSEPKDLLIKKDRDELVESIARLNNIC
ncbi:essential nuclear protein 1 [Mytilus galloprovincialis]|uniref:Essential nuclear protein 1 n=1 Tax=Mytilus galloprovincialis TaxID=29158 RepID=A0A8B6DME1_MYTGA|nr:essential nuclear protein 1 [Mytilus galloprovincialis]